MASGGRGHAWAMSQQNVTRVSRWADTTGTKEEHDNLSFALCK